ncbi:MAG: hypothetical protein EP323_05440 [Gammaproteobacteria bacterium]|nr:MAG: hypothetical protein EP323_05440 [Gammaproteobacteria bacterium]
MFLPRCFVVILASVLLQTHALAIEPATSGEELLQRMAEANRQLDYTGIFTYEHGGTLKTVKVFHAIQDGREVERLVLLSGPKQEILHQGNDVNCQHMGNAILRGNAVGLTSIPEQQLNNYYSVQLKPDNRVAGRDVVVLHVVPKDEHRYGYVLGIDKETGLLLQSLLVGNKNRVLERFQYVDITIGDTVSDDDLKASGDAKHLVSPGTSNCLNRGSLPNVEPGNWKAGWLPPGYTMAGHELAEATARETLIYTDGLSVFSLFVDPEMSANLPQMQAQRGATVAYLSRVTVDGRDYTICVVGEIPVETAKMVAQSVSPREIPP